MKKTFRIIGIVIAAAATVSGVLGIVGMFTNSEAYAVELILGFVGAVIAYIFAGGFGKSVKAAGKIARFGWICTPFPVDLLTGLVCFFFAVLAFLEIPLVFVLAGGKKTEE